MIFTNKIIKPCSDGQDRWTNRGFGPTAIASFSFGNECERLFVALILKVQRTFM